MLAKVADLQQEQREEQLLQQQQQEEEEAEEQGPKVHTGFKNAYVSVNRTLSAVVWSATDGRLEVRRLIGLSFYRSVCQSASCRREFSCCLLLWGCGIAMMLLPTPPSFRPM